MNSKNRKRLLILSVAVLVLGIGSFAFVEFGSAPQPSPIKKVGIVQYLDILDPAVEGFKEEMRELGYEEGKDVVYLYGSARGKDEQTTAIAQEFIAQDVDLLYAVTAVAARGALDASISARRGDIPIVFAHGDNPIEAGLVHDLKSSGNHVTGIAVDLSQLIAKKLELLKQINPEATTVAVFLSASPPNAGQLALAELQKQAPRQGIIVRQYTIEETPAALQETLGMIRPGEIDAIMALPSPVTSNLVNAKMVADFGKESKIPTIALTAPQVESGFLFTYAHDLHAVGRQAAVLVDKTWQNLPPDQIPIEFPEHNNLIVNFRTAEIMQIDLPESLLLGVDIQITR